MPKKYFFQSEKGKYGLLGKHSNTLPVHPISTSKEKIPEEHIQEFYKNILKKRSDI